MKTQDPPVARFSSPLVLAYADHNGNKIMLLNEQGDTKHLFSCQAPYGIAANGAQTVYVACGHGSWIASLYEVPVDLAAEPLDKSTLDPIWAYSANWVMWTGLVHRGTSLFSAIDGCYGWADLNEGNPNPGVIEFSLDTYEMAIHTMMTCNFSNHGIGVTSGGTVYLADWETVSATYNADGVAVEKDYDDLIRRVQPGEDSPSLWLDTFTFEPKAAIMDLATHPVTDELYVLASDFYEAKESTVYVYNADGAQVDMLAAAPLARRLTVSSAGDIYLQSAFQQPITHIHPDGTVTAIEGTSVIGAGGITVME